MGKRQHQKDKLYLTTAEWRDFYGGNKSKLTADNATSGTYVRLPFCCCSITFQPFEEPCCSPDGAIYEKKNIINFLAKFGRHPITGKSLKVDELVDLHFHKNAQNEFCCPVTYRVFNEHSHIVAIRTTGNVYSWDAVEVLNFKTENFRDLLNDFPFKGKEDVIRLQDPINVERFDISKFYHVRFALKANEEDSSRPEYYLNNLNSDAQTALKKIKVSASSEQQQNHKKIEESLKSPSKDKFPGRLQSSNISTGALAASFTSTAMERVSHLTPRTRSIESIVWNRLRSKPCKAYVSIQTNLGPLNLELYASDTPKTVHNFLLLCRRKYYDNCLFFRSIKHFIVQTGDPTNTGRGGQSAWPNEPKFEDEFPGKPLKHDRRGVLSMANSGPNTNGSQFFITYRPCNQLTKKHTIFGRLVGGFDTLSKIEAIDVDDKDKPKVDVRILRTLIFEDPAKKIEDDIQQELEKEEADSEPQKKQPDTKLRAVPNKTIGKYISIPTANSNEKKTDTMPSEYEMKKKIKLIEAKRQRLDFQQWD